MKNKKMSRKGFLKLAGGAIALAFLSKFGKLEKAEKFALAGKGEADYGKSSYGGKK